MGRALTVPNARFKPGDRVRVRMEDRPGHIRTPWYIRGKTGWVERVHGEFLNPESLGHGGDGLPKRPLYLVAFEQPEVWGAYGARRDKLLVDIYEHWLDPA
ncbi:MAG TPA: SH3-like domain-containing protein [Candidatus Eisenbacteria bacterium]|nr:SH3-like domain-containing protein [Candidatus Eisenbacteria bacterium]